MNLKAEVLLSGSTYRALFLAHNKSVVSWPIIFDGLFLRKGGVLAGLCIYKRNDLCLLTHRMKKTDNKEGPIEKNYNHRTKAIPIISAKKYKLPTSYSNEVSRCTHFKLYG